jgi:hypothetical protein
MLMHQDNSQYDFIMQKKSMGDGGPLNSAALRSRILIAFGGAIILLVVGAIVFSFIFKGGDKASADLLTAAQQQNELIRVADIGTKKSRSTATVNYATTTELSLQTDQRLLLANMKANKLGVSTKTLEATKNTATDSALTVADQNNSFDTAFTTTLQTQLNTYRQTIKRAYDATTNKKTKQLLSNCYAHVNTLLQVQGPSTSN